MQKELDKANKNAEEVKSNWENLRKKRRKRREARKNEWSDRRKKR